MLLTLDDIQVSYGQVAALKGVSLAIKPGGFVALIGANGAGKSTTLRAISGLEPLTRGDIIFCGQHINQLATDKIVARGIAHVPEGRHVFKDLTVTENLLLGAFLRDDQTAINSDLKQLFDYFPRLGERQHQVARTMSGGEQQMVAIGRALMSRPQLLLLDEPSLGLAPIIVQEIAKILVTINQQGVAIILVEQNAELALALADYGYVLETGNITLADDAKQLKNNDHVRQAYLGV